MNSRFINKGFSECKYRKEILNPQSEYIGLDPIP